MPALCGSAPIVLKKRPLFLAVAATRRKAVTPGLILQVGDPSPSGPQEEAFPFRYGLTASYHAVGNAVARNRARRRLRALVLEIMVSHAAPGRDYVLIARKETVTRSWDLLRQDLAQALKKQGVWREG